MLTEKDLKEFRYRGMKIPAIAGRSLLNYINDHLSVGHFLSAVIANDLNSAVSHADGENLPAIPVLSAFLYNRAPQNCWGSWEAYTKWLEHREV